MKSNSFFIVLIISLNSFSQESLNKKGDYFANYFFGNATIVSDNEYKVTADVVGGAIGKEFILDKQFSIITAIEYMRIQNEIPQANNAAQLFLVNNFIKIPVLIRYGFDIMEKSTLYAETGIYGASLYKSKVENIALSSTKKETTIGYNLGLDINIGFKQQLNSIYSFNFGLNSQADIFQSYDNSRADLKIVEVFTFELGFGVKL